MYKLMNSQLFNVLVVKWRRKNMILATTILIMDCFQRFLYLLWDGVYRRAVYFHPSQANCEYKYIYIL